MELLKQVRHMWLEYNTKGQWETKSGDKIYIEEMTDEHLMRIPPYIYRRLNKDQKEIAWSFIPWIIKTEIRERNMYIDYKAQCVVKQLAPVISGKPVNKTPVKKKRNSILFK